MVLGVKLSRLSGKKLRMPIHYHNQLRFVGEHRTMSCTRIQIISECFVRPKSSSEQLRKPVYLSPWDLAMLSFNYIQKGLLFTRPQSFNRDTFLQRLEHSLALTLDHFHPLAGRLSTLKGENPPLYTAFVDCENSPGARLVQASLELSISDILSPGDVPLIVQSLFDHDRAINHDGHERSLLTIQVTELRDGIFLGCSMNHVIGDGASFWHFLNTFSEIFRSSDHHELVPISSPPIHTRWFPENHGPILNLPFTHHDQFTSRLESPPLRERILHFSAESLSKLKARANAECKTDTPTSTILSLQALSAHTWRSIIRARKAPSDQLTYCFMAINNRSRLDPPLSNDYFGNSVYVVWGTASAGELLDQGNGVGWAAMKLHQEVAKYDNATIREHVKAWIESPSVYQPGQFAPYCVHMGSSPRFDMYGVEFGLGRGIAIRSGYANKFDGKVSLYPGVEGGDSMDLEICLLLRH